jgi:hypothetical protein
VGVEAGRSLRGTLTFSGQIGFTKDPCQVGQIGDCLGLICADIARVSAQGVDRFVDEGLCGRRLPIIDQPRDQVLQRLGKFDLKVESVGDSRRWGASTSNWNSVSSLLMLANPTWIEACSMRSPGSPRCTLHTPAIV